MKDPFEYGDVIWFEKGGEPIEAFVKQKSGKYRRIGSNHPFEISLELILELMNESSGPYRLAQAENWSAYDFTD